MILKRNDLCLIRNVEGVDKSLRGRECIVLTPLINRRHEVDVIGLELPDGWRVLANPAHLEKLPPPNTKLESWADCVWRPKEFAQ